jgi:outer membrane protein assembly factor BamB
MWRALGLVCCGSVLMSGLVNAAEPAEWPQWRGPQRNGVAAGAAEWPSSLAESRFQRAWRVNLSPSYSGPIVAADRVFVTETVDQTTERVSALDRATGRNLWTAEWPGATSVPFFAKSNGDWIRATPAFDGESLFVAGMRDILVCLDAASGTERWRVDFVDRHQAQLPAFGFVSSPLVTDDAVYVQAGGCCCRIDKQTGETVWRTLQDGGGMNGSAFSSPVLTRLHGRPQLLFQTRDKLAGVAPETGTVLWSTAVEAFRGMNILTPTVVDNRLFTSTYGGGSFLFAVEQPAPDGAANVAQVWRSKLQGYMSTPVVHEGHAYMHLRNQRFACLDLATGKEKWITQPYGKYWSLVAHGDRLLALDETGELLLIRMTPERFDLIDRRELIDNAWAHLAVAGSEVYIRDLAGLSRYNWK